MIGAVRIMGIGNDDYHAGIGSAKCGHPKPGSWASSEFMRGWNDWIKFSTPKVTRR